MLDQTRLLTLTGAGGCGKTRLALEVATQYSDAFEHGVWWVELAALTDAALVPQAVATALDIREFLGQPLVQTLLNYLRPKQLLLVLDNCDHLISACAELTNTLLSECPNLKILVTSRERTGSAGETIWLVPSLAFPDPQPLLPPARLSQYESIRLFMDRAIAVKSDLGLTADNSPFIAQICYRLDGIPLAIELAAARVGMLTLGQIAERVDDSMRLLTRGSWSVLPRHQTLRAMIDWSYALLSEKERLVFRRLSVFSGGFTLEAAEATCSGGEIAEVEMLDILSDLTDKSLVMADTQTRSEARYRVLEPLRQYAVEKLQQSGEEPIYRRCHLTWCLGLAEHADTLLRGPQQVVWLERLESEHDNLRAALAWSQAEGASRDDLEEGLHLAGALFWFWNFRGYWTEGRRWMEQLSAQTVESGNTPASAQVLFGIGEFARLQSDYATEQLRLEQSAAMWRALVAQAGSVPTTAVAGKERTGRLRQAQRGLAMALVGLSYMAWYHANHATWRALIEEGLTLFRVVGDKWGIGYALTSQGIFTYHEGDYTMARNLLNEGLGAFRETLDKWGIALALDWRGASALGLADYAAARADLEEDLALNRELGDKWNTANALNRLGEVARSQGEDTRALSLYEETIAIHRELGSKWGLCFSLHNLGHVELHLGNPKRAAALFKEALTFNQERQDFLGTASCLAGLASAAVANGNPARAVQLFGATQALLDKLGGVLAPSDFREFERHLASARARLDNSMYAAAWAAGQTLTLEDALALAMVESTALRPSDQVELLIFALGTIKVQRGELELGSADWVYAKAKELLFYLLSDDARTKEQIGLDLWPDASPAQLRNNLGITLHHLRRALGRAEWIVFDKDRYFFNRKLGYWFDVNIFESKIVQARQCTSPAQAAVFLEDAIELYRGEFMEDWMEGSWHTLRREELRRKYSDALLLLGQIFFADGKYARSAYFYRRAITHDNLLETAHRELMR
ncbi:MAG: tetratricopeptide repeat protein, partial [Acidobacteriota bacterium]